MTLLFLVLGSGEVLRPPNLANPKFKNRALVQASSSIEEF